MSTVVFAMSTPKDEDEDQLLNAEAEKEMRREQVETDRRRPRGRPGEECQDRRAGFGHEGEQLRENCLFFSCR